MDFFKKRTSIFMEGTTKKGNTICYVPVPENRLTFYTDNNENTRIIPNKSLKDYEKDDVSETEQKEPSVITLYCGFKVSTKMLDEFESSKIVKVKKMLNYQTQVELYPLFGFDFEKLKDVIYDICVKFNL